MRMTKQHFEALARALREVTPLARDGYNAMKQWERTVQKIADVCAVSNVSFERAAFMHAARGEA